MLQPFPSLGRFRTYIIRKIKTLYYNLWHFKMQNQQQVHPYFYGAVYLEIRAMLKKEF